jgi:hypothetical protein
VAESNVADASSHSRESAKGILFALAIAGGFYGSAYVAAFFIDHPMLFVLAACVFALVVMACARKEGAR